jgi:hypothetical protein
MVENKIIRENNWCEETSFLIKKWDRICFQRKHMHNRAANSYDLKNKLLSIPIILISTILGSLSFISSSRPNSSGSRMLSVRELQPECVCFSYMNGASSGDGDLCMKGTECYPPNIGDGLCPGDMTACVSILTESTSANCHWETYDDNSMISEYPYCDQSIIRYDDDIFRSSLIPVEARFCDRTVDFVDNAAYQQLSIPASITNQDHIEAWCIRYDEGYGVFYQQYAVDGTNMCCVLTEEAGISIFHGHTLGGVCLPSGHFDSPSNIYIKRCGALTRELCEWGEGPEEYIGKRPECTEAQININHETQEKTNYYFESLDKCQSLCESTNDCNVVSRYSGEEDNEEWHCYFYHCPIFPDIFWVEQTEWGDGANGAQTYLLECPDPPDHETEEPAGEDCSNNCCISGPDMWTHDASPTIPGWTLESPYLDHTNGGTGKKNQCEDMCRDDPQCNSWMWRSSASTCYLSTYAELKEYRPNSGYNDHHPHEFWRGCTTMPTFSTTKTPTTTPTTSPTISPTPPFEGKSGKSGKSGDSEGDGEGDGDGEKCAPGCPDDWPGDGVCDDSCFNSACNYDDGDCPTTSPTNLPTTSFPTPDPTKQPTPDPTKHPTPQPTKHPTPDPTKHPTSYNQNTETNDDNSSSIYTIFPYIIGAFNMFVAVLSALHTFLKYDALEDRHRQYSRHFGALQLDLEALMAKSPSQRGDPVTILERYKTKYAVLINNAPSLPEQMERICCISDADPNRITTIELTTI